MGINLERARVNLFIPVEEVVEDHGATGFGQEGALQPDDATGRDVVFEVQVAVDRQFHVAQLAPAPADFLDHLSLVLDRHFDGQLFIGLQRLAVHLAHDDLGLGDLQLIAFPPHRLDEDRQMQFAAPGDQELVGGVGLLHAQGDVGFQFLEQPVAEIPGRDVFAFPPGEGAGVDREGHLDRRLVDRHGRQCQRLFGVRQRLADPDLGEPGDGHDLSGLDLVHFLALQPFEDQEVGDFPGDHGPVGLDADNRLALGERAGQQLADAHFALVRVLDQGQDQHLEGPVGHDRRGRDRVQDRVEQGRDVHAALLRIEGRGPLDGGGIDDGEVQLLIGGAEMGEQIKRAVDDILDLGVGAVHLVDDDDGLVPQAQRLAQHEGGLRHGAFLGVDQQEDAVHHAEGALDFPAEIGVARRVHDVDLDPVVDDAGVLGPDGDAALALLVHRVHDAFAHACDVAVHVGLFQDRVDEGRLPVVHMGDDGDISKIRAAHTSYCPPGIKKAARRRRATSILTITHEPARSQRTRALW